MVSYCLNSTIAKKGLVIVCILISSCINDKKFYTISFNKNVADSLKTFAAIASKLPRVNFLQSDSETSTMIDSEKGSVVIQYDKNQLVYKRNEIPFSLADKNYKRYYKLKDLQKLTPNQKKLFFEGFNCMIRNEVDGYRYDAEPPVISSFFYKGWPFHNRHGMFMIIEDEFKALKETEKKFLLEGHLIIERKYGLILFAIDKGRFLTFMFGSEERIPKKWSIPTEKTFRIGIDN